MTYYGLRIFRIPDFRIPGVPGLHLVPWHRGSGCFGAAAPVTGAAADEYNLNVVDCNAHLSQWGSGGPGYFGTLVDFSSRYC
jgi:hypothetical protein